MGSLIFLAICVLIIASLWITFTKADRPGWAAIIPFYNMYVLTQIAGRPWWWMILMFIPLVGIVIAIILSIDIAKAFGKGAGFGLGLAFLGFIFYPILAFTDVNYEQPFR